MKTLKWMGGALWVLLVICSYYLGRSSSPPQESSLPIYGGKLGESRVEFLTDRSRDDRITTFEKRLPMRDDLTVHDELWLLADRWALESPEDAVTWLSELKFNDPRNPYLFAALSQWASRDPQKAMAWFESHQPVERESAEYLKAGLIRGMARKNPEDALEFLLGQSKALGRSAIDFILGAWSQEGAGVLFAGIDAIPLDRPDLRLEAYRKAASHLTYSMLGTARDHALNLENQEERRALQSAIANRWAQRDPVAALQWAGEVSDPRVTGIVAKYWARQEPLEASAWLETRKGGAGYDLSARAVAWSVVGMDPQRAFLQISGMQSEGLRRETFEQVGRFWISDQPQAARAYLENDNLFPADIREDLLSHFRR